MAMGKSATINYKLYYEETQPLIEVWEELIAKQDEMIRMKEALIANLESAYRTQGALIANLEALNANLETLNSALESANTELKIEVESQGRELHQLKEMALGAQDERVVTADRKARQPGKEDD